MLPTKQVKLDRVTPPSPERINDPDHWRDRAREARTIAAQMSDPHAVEAMMGVAEEYNLLAERA
jgi:hypothetical protein